MQINLETPNFSLQPTLKRPRRLSSALDQEKDKHEADILAISDAVGLAASLGETKPPLEEIVFGNDNRRVLGGVWQPIAGGN